MSKLKGKSITKGFSGIVGGVLIRTVRGQTQLVMPPSSRKSNSHKQQIAIDKFKRASSYAKGQMKIPEVANEYQKGVKGKLTSAHQVAVADSLNAPVINYIVADKYKGAIGDIITISAEDDFKVVSVEVRIYQPGQEIELERGLALPTQQRYWIFKYKATKANAELKGTRIWVRVMDMPDNETGGGSCL